MGSTRPTFPFKYFAWIEEGYWRGQKLLSVSEIQSLLKVLNWRFPVFATIQNYDGTGEILSCPIFLDLDGPKDLVLKDARHVLQAFQYVLGVTPKIYFSGGKGFHFVLPYMIHDPRCHEIVAHVVRELCPVSTLDTRVYRPRSMFRIPGSPGSRHGLYKIELKSSTLLTKSYDEILELAKKPWIDPEECDLSKLDEDLLLEQIAIARKSLRVLKTIDDLKHESYGLSVEITPCIRSLIGKEMPEGERNHAAFVLAKFFKNAGVAQESAVGLLLEQPHWQEFEQSGEVRKVFRSVYHSNRPSTLGCKHGTDAPLLRTYCDKWCFFREDLPKVIFNDSKPSFDTQNETTKA